MFAVLVPYVAHRDEECILLTKRPASLKRYAGQVALPGGAREPEDQSLEETALREAEEEVGIPRHLVDVVAELGWHQTTLRHRVKPFVGRLCGHFHVRPNPREVERVLYLPTRRLDAALFDVRGEWTDPGGTVHTIYTFDLDGFEVWGLTARILREVVLGPEGSR